MPPRAADVRTDSYLLARSLLLVMFATALDVWNYLDKGGWPRYFLLFIPLGMFGLIRLRSPSPYIRHPAGPDRVLLVLLVLGLTGTLYGILVRGTPATALPIFLPMVIAFLYLGCLQDPTSRETRRVLRWIEWLGLSYASLAAVVGSGLLPGLGEFRQFRNASLVFMALALAATIVRRHWGRAVLVLGLWGVVFAFYPSGTSILVGLTVVVTLLMMPAGPSRIRPYLLGGAATMAIILVVLNFNAWVQLSNDYFSLVGKSNNNSARLAVWTVGMDRFGESPIFGEFFSGPTVTTAVKEGTSKEFQIPYHNDYILFLANGGIVGFGLLVVWIVGTELLVLRRYMDLVYAGDRDRAALLRILLVGYNAFFVTSAFNPSISGVARSATIFSIYSLMMMIRRSPRQAEPS
jgi:O-antigen ligase